MPYCLLLEEAEYIEFIFLFCLKESEYSFNVDIT